MRRGLVAGIACAAVSLALGAPARAQVRGDWHTVGSAVLQGGHLILTPDVPELAGAAWRTPAMRLRNRFHASFGFVLSDSPAHSDGFAFVIQGDSVDALGGAGGGLGYTGIPDSLAVEFDTWHNIAADFGSPTSVDDPAAPHISVHTRGTLPNDVDEQYSLGSTTDIPLLSDGTPHSVDILYRRRALHVVFDGAEKLEVPINLRRVLAVHRRHVWFGFTAATGGGSQQHEILSFALRRR